LSFFAAVWRRRTALAAENLFLRKQLPLFREREKKALATTPDDRFVFSKLTRWFDWRSALVIVKPATLIGWHRAAFRRSWRWKSRPVGRPQVTSEVRNLIRRLAADNPTWGEKRIADELLLKLQIRLTPRTVAKYSKQLPGPRRSRDQRWLTFLKNHAQAIVACDFFTAVTVTFRVIHVFVALKIGSRRLFHFNATEHPTAEWTLQQLPKRCPEQVSTARSSQHLCAGSLFGRRIARDSQGSKRAARTARGSGRPRLYHDEHAAQQARRSHPHRRGYLKVPAR
jgi:hypothetical protein